MARAVDAVTDLALEEAHNASRGNLSLPFLRQAGHPFSAANPNPLFDPSIINKHTGAGGFDESWRRTPVQLNGFEIGAQVVNDNRVADWLQHGTPAMVARPVQQRVEDAVMTRLREGLGSRLRVANVGQAKAFPGLQALPFGSTSTPALPGTF